MARMGMDVDEVERIAGELKNKAHELENLIRDIDSKVSSLSGVWDGADVGQFQNEWNGGLKGGMNQAKTAIEELSGKAKSNAAAQRDVSSRLG